MITEALERTGGNKNRAAELLGLNRTTLVEKLRRKRLGPPPS
jgi:sigma-54 specific flagellar transcriptional regulator A